VTQFRERLRLQESLIYAQTVIDGYDLFRHHVANRLYLWRGKGDLVPTSSAPPFAQCSPGDDPAFIRFDEKRRGDHRTLKQTA
jgi:hypothetical protein